MNCLKLYSTASQERKKKNRLGVEFCDVPEFEGVENSVAVFVQIEDLER